MVDWGNNPATWQAIASMVAAAGVVAVLWSLWNTREQRRTVQNEIALRQRPWVGLNMMHYEYKPAELEDWLTFEYFNIGSLPAHDLICILRIVPVANNEQAPPWEKFSPSSVMMPNEPGRYWLIFSPSDPFAKWRDQLRDVLIDGEFSYGFGGKQFSTKFSITLKFSKLAGQHPSKVSIDQGNVSAT